MMSSPTTENTSEMPINTESVSHQILNKLDDIKQKLTDNEYKEFAELLQQQYKNSDDIYTMTILVPLIKKNIEASGGACECCDREWEDGFDLELRSIDVTQKMKTEMATKISGKINSDGPYRVKFSHGSFDYSCHNDKERECLQANGLLVEILTQMSNTMNIHNKLFRIYQQPIYITKLIKMER
jgi:hypothetical protein